ncbi:pseudouridine synthase [Terrimonas pollutisoli]|uniref:pseudouridine synthase n=1 Tax=Terrimonas pollutisoli TaxID=3034147 RepID=UPI0023ED5D16|nr:pseudouridine synthase [Terrimonas sp. H1YJ31]
MKKKSTPFDKFAKKKSNAAIKEQFKQEKRKIKKEREEYFEQKRAEARKQKLEAGSQRSEVTGQKSKVRGQKEEVRSQKTEVRSQRSEVASRNQLATGDQQPVTSNRQLTTLMPLNKFLAHSGVAARREAAEIVKQGRVKVNKIVITEPGHKVSAQDDIRINGKRVFVSKNLVYILLNKPKDYITTTDDPQGRKTVLDIIGNATTERIYPVGRLDRNTSGVLLLTNDGELSQKLTHPSNQIKKVYHVTLDKPLEKKDFEKILSGVTLEDGPASVDVLAYADIKDKTQIGVEIHSGRNRIVRRIFESLGYDVKNLDRVIFAGLTKKNVERGKWRFLTEKEVRDLKHFGKGK